MIALLTFVMLSPTPNPSIGREVGQFFPPLVLPSLDGRKTVALSDFRGRKVLLIEFASW